MDGLFEYVGITLEKSNRRKEEPHLVSIKVLELLAKKASIRAANAADCSPVLLEDEIFETLRDYFFQDMNPTLDLSAKNEIINVMGNYLIMQDKLECHSIKEVNILASGLYDSVISQIVKLARMSVEIETDLKISQTKSLVRVGQTGLDQSSGVPIRDHTVMDQFGI
jgi:hypothetical protein